MVCIFKHNNIKVLVTGSKGLIGKRLVKKLKNIGFKVKEFDIKFPQNHESHGNILDSRQLFQAVEGCQGVVHLAAVSRVIFGERDPKLCMTTNHFGTKKVIDACRKHNAWVIFSSSREVYGQQKSLPVFADAKYSPVNVYAESKVKAEEEVLKVRDYINTAIVRYSNVYGSIYDYADRVVPAFCRAAVLDKPLILEGCSNTFDFTHLEDSVEGTISVIYKMLEGMPPPPLHFTTGIPTTLLDLSNLVLKCSNRSANNIIEGVPRNFDVGNFYGDTSKTESILGWKAKVSLQSGIANLVKEFQRNIHQVCV